MVLQKDTMCKKWLVTALVLGTLATEVVSKTGKAALFLKSSAFEGDPPDEDAAYDDATAVDSPAAHKVLFGHYSAILEMRQQVPAPRLDDAFSGRSMSGRPKEVRSRIKEKLSKIVELYRKNLFITIQAAVNFTRGGKADEFESQMESCKSTLKECESMEDVEIRCGVECLSKGNDKFDNLINTITGLVDQFCFPINSIFDKIFDLKGNRHPILRRFILFLKQFAVTKKSWVDVALQGVAALVPTIIDKLRTDMMPYRLFIDKLETELDAEQLLQPQVRPDKMIGNMLCSSVDDVDVAEGLLDVLYRNPTLVEAVLGGLSVMNLVTKYMFGNFRVPFAASAEAIRIMTGSICGLLEYAETGSVPSCDQIGGFPVTGIPLPSIPEMPDLNQECLQGAVMNGEDKDDEEEEGGSVQNTATTPAAAKPTTTPPAGKKPKRENGFGMNVAKAVKDGTGGAASVSQVSGNGASARRKKRTLVVGQKK